MAVQRYTSPESASTPISGGGWKYHHDDPQDRADFADCTEPELRVLMGSGGFDFTDHPALAPQDRRD